MSESEPTQDELHAANKKRRAAVKAAREKRHLERVAEIRAKADKFLASIPEMKAARSREEKLALANQKIAALHESIKKGD